MTATRPVTQFCLSVWNMTCYSVVIRSTAWGGSSVCHTLENNKQSTSPWKTCTCLVTGTRDKRERERLIRLWTCYRTLKTPRATSRKDNISTYILNFPFWWPIQLDTQGVLILQMCVNEKATVIVSSCAHVLHNYCIHIPQFSSHCPLWNSLQWTFEPSIRCWLDEHRK